MGIAIADRKNRCDFGALRGKVGKASWKKVLLEELQTSKRPVLTLYE